MSFNHLNPIRWHFNIIQFDVYFIFIYFLFIHIFKGLVYAVVCVCASRSCEYSRSGLHVFKEH